MAASRNRTRRPARGGVGSNQYQTVGAPTEQKALSRSQRFTTRPPRAIGQPMSGLVILYEANLEPERARILHDTYAGDVNAMLAGPCAMGQNREAHPEWPTDEEQTAIATAVLAHAARDGWSPDEEPLVFRAFLEADDRWAGRARRDHPVDEATARSVLRAVGVTDEAMTAPYPHGNPYPYEGASLLAKYRHGAAPAHSASGFGVSLDRLLGGPAGPERTERCQALVDAAERMTR